MALVYLSCTTSPPWVSLNTSGVDQCGARRNRTKGLTSAHRTSRGDTPSAPRSRYLLTPTHTNTDTTQNIFSSCLYPLPPCMYTLKGISHRDILFVSLYPCLSRIRNTYTYPL